MRPIHNLTDSELKAALRAAVRAGQAAGRLMRSHLRRQKTVNKISAHDVKLELDAECQETIARHLLKVFPSIAVVGEEGVHGPPLSEFKWVIDPIDGTVNFFHGIPHAAVSIALQARTEMDIGAASQPTKSHAFQSVVAVVYDPFLNELWTAIKGDSTKLNGRPVSVSACSRLGGSMISMGFGKNPAHLDLALPLFRYLSLKAQKVRIMGSASLALAYVASGRFDAHIAVGIRLWDVAAGSLIVTCAGGTVQAQGLTLSQGGVIIATNSHLGRYLKKLAEPLF